MLCTEMIFNNEISDGAVRELYQKAARGKKGNGGESITVRTVSVETHSPAQQLYLLTYLVQRSSCVVDIHPTDRTGFLKAGDERALGIRPCSTHRARGVSGDIGYTHFSQQSQHSED